ncbi:MAG: hypothetical protein LBB88_08375 [Planctomycetaceae bacterium]|nr:hypothetical protein [Planctomycetaceae bacterium]
MLVNVDYNVIKFADQRLANAISFVLPFNYLKSETPSSERTVIETVTEVVET